MEEMSLHEALIAGEAAARKQGFVFSPNKAKLSYELSNTRGHAGTLILAAGKTGYRLINYSAPAIKKSDFTTDALLECVKKHYGLSAATAFLSVGAIPLSKIRLGYPLRPGASKFTNPISHFGHKFYPRSLLSHGSLAARSAKSVFGTIRVFGLLGRANLVGFIGFAIFDVISIAHCLDKK